MAAHAGIYYSDSRPVSRPVIDALRNVNRVLGPDRFGLYTTDGLAMLSFALHFDRLSECEQQPIHTIPGSVLTWDGRLDNREDFIVRLPTVLADDHTDATLMAAAVQKWQNDALQMALGDWSLAFWNERNHSLLLARDYAGNRPLYYCQRPEYVIWSTAIEPIVEICGLAADINDTFIGGWLTFNPPPHHTCYRNIFAVPAGHVLRFSQDGHVTDQPFPSFVPHTLRYRDISQYAERYRELFTQAVKVRLRARLPVWTELSGGYDSSSITCVASALVRAGAVEAPSLQPVSIIMPDAPESDERHFIECVEHFCQLRSVRLSFASSFDLDPHVTASPSDKHQHDDRSTYSLTAQAASHVLLSGDFGDAVTAAVTGNHLLMDHLLAARLWPFVVDSVNYCRGTRQSLFEAWLSLAKESFQWMAPHRPSADDLVESTGLRRDFIERSVLPLSPATQVPARIPRSNESLSRSFHDFVVRDLFIAVRDIRPVTVTHPFSHRPLIDFMLAIPPRAVWSPRHPRTFVCTALRDILPDAIIARKSKGFAPPAIFRRLRSTVAAALLEVDTLQLVKRGYADPPGLVKLFGAFLTGSRHADGSVPLNQAVVHRLLSTERLLRVIQWRETAGKHNGAAMEASHTTCTT
jgi:hypothetical protein